MPSKLLLVISLIFVLILIPGCWSRREIEDLAIVSAIAIDQVNPDGPQRYRLSLQVIRPGQLGGGQRMAGGGGGGGGGKTPGWLVTSYGETLYDALRNMLIRSPRSIALYHSRAVIIGEKTARNGIEDVLDFLSRNKDVRLRTFICVSEGEALSVLQSAPELEKLLSEEMSEILIKTSHRSSKTRAVDLREFARELVTPGIDAVAAKVAVVNVRETAGEDPAIRSGDPLKSITIHGLGVFRRDRLAGWLNDNESRGYLFITGRTGSGILPIRLGGEKKQKISFLMTRSASKIIPRLEGEKPRIIVQIKAEGDLAEVEYPDHIATPESLARLNSDVAKKIRELAQAAVKKTQKNYRADIFGFGAQIHKKNPKYWKTIEGEWNEIYANIDVDIRVTAKIRRTGMITEPYKIK